MTHTAQQAARGRFAEGSLVMTLSRRHTGRRGGRAWWPKRTIVVGKIVEVYNPGWGGR